MKVASLTSVRKRRALLYGYVQNHIRNKFSWISKKTKEQYGGFELHSFAKSHHRFLIIDAQEVYHLGTSLKDLGKRCFAFSKLVKSSVDGLLKRINELID